MLELNRKAEVSIHGQTADIEFTLDYDEGKWKLRVVDTTWNEYFKKPYDITLTNDQAACMMHLFIDAEATLSDVLYDSLKDVKLPPNLSLVP